MAPHLAPTSIIKGAINNVAYYVTLFFIFFYPWENKAIKGMLCFLEISAVVK